MASRSIVKCCSKFNTSTSSTARTFTQLAPRRSFHSAPPVLDFLLPSIPRSASQHGWTGRSLFLRGPKQTRRAFAASAKRQTTTAIYNARDDDDGNSMRIEITPRASNRLKDIMAKDGNPNLALRIQVESGGCHGFQYLMSLTTLPPVESYTSSSIQSEEAPALNTSSNDPNAIPSRIPGSGPFPDSANTHTKAEESPALNTSSNDPNAMPSRTPGSAPFSESVNKKEGELDEDDTVFAADDGSGAKVVMDGPSLELLKGSKVDFTMELIGSQFKIVDNPLATSSCGCGTSFDIK